MVKRFEEVLDIKNGKNQKTVENPNGVYPIYGSGGIMGYADQYLCEANTVIIGRKGSINKPIFVETPFWNVDTAFGLIAKPEYLMPKYLYYFCQYFDFERLSTTVTIPSLTKANLNKIKIKFPELSQQRQQVEILDKTKGLIDSRNEQLKELDNLIKSRFVEMFGDPVTNPMDWPVQNLGDVCDVRDGTHDSPKYVDEGYPLVTSKNVVNGYIDFTNTNNISKTDYEKINKRSKVDEGDILMPMIGTVGNPIIVRSSKEFAIKNVALIKFSDSVIVSNVYIKALLESDYFENAVSKNKRGGTQKFIALGDIRKFKIQVPLMDLQNEFSNFINQTNQLKDSIKKSLNETQILFDSLMQEYFE